MVAFKFTLVISATVLALTFAAPTTHHAELEARTFEDVPRDLQQRPATVSSLQGVTSTFSSTFKSHRKDKKVLTGLPSGKRQHRTFENYHGDHQRHRVLSNNIDGSQTHELDSAESHPRLNKRLPPFPSKHHCPVCHKSPKGAGYCKDHQWVCDDHNGRPWVQTVGEKCQNCGSPSPKRGKKKRR